MTTSNLVHGSHAVHFYDDERPLYDAVIRYLGWGLETGEAAVVIATPAHRNEFERQLSMCALDVGAAKRRRQLILLDAQTTLDRFMDGPLVDSERCLEVLGGILDEVAGNGFAKVRAYGEMVHLLWTAGNPAGAVRLEELWNELGRGGENGPVVPFSLLCGYHVSCFANQAHPNELAAVYRSHAQVESTSRQAPDFAFYN
jgi:hypothetical protein